MKIPSLPKGAVGFPIIAVIAVVGIYYIMKQRSKN